MFTALVVLMVLSRGDMIQRNHNKKNQSVSAASESVCAKRSAEHEL